MLLTFEQMFTIIFKMRATTIYIYIYMQSNMATSTKDEAFVICFRSNTPSNYQFGNFTMYLACSKLNIVTTTIVKTKMWFIASNVESLATLHVIVTTLSRRMWKDLENVKTRSPTL